MFTIQFANGVRMSAQSMDEAEGAAEMFRSLAGAATITRWTEEEEAALLAAL